MEFAVSGSLRNLTVEIKAGRDHPQEASSGQISSGRAGHCELELDGSL